MPTKTARNDVKTGEFDRAHVVATYFGFSPVSAPKISKEDISLTSHFGEDPYYDALEKVALTRAFLARAAAGLQEPIAWIYRKPPSRRKFGTHGLHFIGSPSAIAEAALIRTTLSILSEEGYKNLRVDINCIGDKESIAAYERELANHTRQFVSELPEELRHQLKENIFSVFSPSIPEFARIRETAPSSIGFLSPQSRAYFKEVLEYVEALGIEFRLAPDLVGEKNHASHAVFAIREVPDEGSEETLAIGYRYSRLARLFGSRKEIPMAGASIFDNPKREGAIKTYKELPRAKFFLIQLGRDAKIKTLSLLELLRTHRIPVYHYLGLDKLGAQLAGAENVKASHLIIIGQKEALDGTATVRNVSTRAQDTVPLARLPGFLKNLPI